MVPAPPRVDLARALRFEEIRAFLRQSHALGLAVLLGVSYALGSLLLGGMLILAPEHVSTTVEVLLGGSAGSWNYPALFVIAPWGVLGLPFFATVSMVVVATGVGLGMAVAVVLTYRLVRPSAEEAARTKSVGIATGLTPAMISLVTIGSCCTTTAAATGGIGLIAQASGTTTTNLVLNNWYLGVAQIAIVWAAVFGQELLLTVYRGLLGLRGAARPSSPVIAPPLDRRWIAGATLRTLLAVGGILWSLSMLAEWTTHPPSTAGLGWWVRWIVQHQLVAAIAVGAAFFPAETGRVLAALRRGPLRVVGALIVIAAASVLAWLPAPLTAWGLESLTDQVLGAVGVPAAWGAIALGPVTGVALVVRWALEFALPAGFALAAVFAPDRAFAPLWATTVRPALAPGRAAPPADSTTVPVAGAEVVSGPAPVAGRSSRGPAPDAP